MINIMAMVRGRFRVVVSVRIMAMVRVRCSVMVRVTCLAFHYG